MATDIEKLRADVDAAKELLAQTQKALDDKMFALVKSGKLEEAVDAEWRERWENCTKKVYCSACHSFGVNAAQTPRCPVCGAHMKNASYLIKKAIVEVIPEDDEEQETLSAQSYSDDAPKQVEIVYEDEQEKTPKYMIEQLMRHGISQVAIGKAIGVSSATISAYKMGALKGTNKNGAETVAQIRKLYDKTMGVPPYMAVNA